MATSTNVEAEVENVAVGRGKVLTVSRLKGALLSRSAALGAETPILLAEDVAIDGIAFHGHRLRVDLDVALFRRHDTRGKLMTAAADATFLRTHAASFFFPARGPAHATIVRSLRWDGDSYPGAVVDGHTVSVPDFGRVFFGEIIIDDSARRLTMMRVELTASHAGHIAFVEVETGGMWHPSHR